MLYFSTDRFYKGYDFSLHLFRIMDQGYGERMLVVDDEENHSEIV